MVNVCVYKTEFLNLFKFYTVNKRGMEVEKRLKEGLIVDDSLPKVFVLI